MKNANAQLWPNIPLRKLLRKPNEKLNDFNLGWDSIVCVSNIWLVGHIWPTEPSSLACGAPGGPGNLGWRTLLQNSRQWVPSFSDRSVSDGCPYPASLTLTLLLPFTLVATTKSGPGLWRSSYLAWVGVGWVWHPWYEQLTFCHLKS